MCGIIAIHSQSSTVDAGAIELALDSIAHRGPDGRGRWISADRQVALAHSRLAVIGGKNGEQPLANEDGSIFLIVNGEVYGHRALRKELESRGHRFGSESDSEVILHLYEDLGTDVLGHLRGEFAFVLWDNRRRLIFAARDRFGIKPLNYSLRDGTLLIASEAKALFALGHPRRWDHEAFFQCASTQYLPGDRTLFAGIRQLPPGHFLVRTDGDLAVREYWDIGYPAAGDPDAHAGNNLDSRELIGEFGRLFDEAVALRLDADDPVAFHLSGGVDSSSVLGFARRRLPVPPVCFTVSFEEDAYDELPVARETAELCGAELVSVPVRQADLLAVLEDAVYASEGLAINGHLPAKFILSRAIRDAGFKVVLTGEGADEVLAGYPHLRQDLLQLGPGAGRGHALEALVAANQASAGMMLAEAGNGLPLDEVRRRLGFIPSFLEPKAVLGRNLHDLMSDDYRARFEGHDGFARILDSLPIDRELRGRHPVHQSLYLWSKTALANYILRTLGDGTEMAHAIEGRLPFLDHRLFEFVRKLPFEMKINGLVEKFILREAARPYITDRVYRRPKHPFVAPPLMRFAHSPILSAVHDIVGGSEFRGMPFFDQAKVTRLLDHLPSMPEKTRAMYDPALMMILTAYYIHRRFAL